jgi:uncharacterized membrane protein YjgN (DUF898 family)
MSNSASNDASNDSNAIDYSSYTLTELEQAYKDIDKDLYPARAKTLASLIQQKLPQDETQAHINQDDIVSKARVIFHGSGTEFFAIWIVNLLLTIVTFGIYSAWATVRTNRYFYSNTEIAGHRLVYLALPMQILIGRLIAFALFALVFISSSFSPIVAVSISLIFTLFIPIIIVMGVRFRMRMMAYRNVRFNFTKRYGRAFVVFLLFPLLGLLSLYLAFPWVLKKMDEFLYENMTYGNKEFKPSLQTSEYYVASILTSIITFAGFMVFGIVAAIGAGTGMIDPENAGSALSLSIATVVGMLFYLFILVLAYSFYQAYIRNHVYNNMQIQDVAIFSSDLKVMDLVLLSITNYLMLVFTLGMAFPWVKVRTTRLLSNATEITILKGIDNVLAESGGQDSAVANEVIGAFDIDVSIG